MAKHWGALRSEWDFFVGQGLGKDLLPVVSNPNATISKNSSLKGLGKTPSRYNYHNEVTGIANWTNVYATEEQVRIWCNQVDYGVCIIARLIKGIDVDVTNTRLADKIRRTIEDFLFDNGILEVPVRSRKDSPKFLVAVRVEDAPLDKAVIDVGEHGIIELLSNKQQFIAAGTHPSGARYEWENIEYGFPVITRDQLTELWQLLKDTYGVKTALNPPNTPGGLRDINNPFAVQDEPIYNTLVDKNMIKSGGSDPGSFNIVCPFAHEHTTEDGGEKDSSTTYFAPHTGGHANASIKCLHAHCAERTTEDFKRAIGLDGVEDFAPINTSNIIALPTPASLLAKKKAFSSKELIDFSDENEPMRWVVKGIFTKSGVGVVLGPPSSGKSFVVLDMAACIARGMPWNGCRTKKGRVVYVMAEGTDGLRQRTRAYRKEHGIDTAAQLPISVINAQPNLLNPEDVAAFISTVRDDHKGQDIALTIFDTYSQCMRGDENSSHDTTQMVRSLQHIGRELDSAVLAIHHTGKNVALGGRGHSSLKGNTDFEIFVAQKDEDSPIRDVWKGKIKDGIEKFKVQFKLKKVHLGKDEDGDDMSSCVVVGVEPEDLVKEPTAEPHKLRRGEELTLATVREYQSKGTRQWPDLEVLVDIIRNLEVQERGKDSARKPYHIRKAINTMVEHKRGIYITKENRVVPLEVETDENAKHESLSLDNDQDRSNVTFFPK